MIGRILRAPLAVSLLSLLLVSCDDNSGGATRLLDGRTFLSQSVDGRDLVAGTQILISFNGDQIGAQAGCNSLGAAYRVDDGHLVIEGDGIVTTDMGCDAPRHAQDEWLSDFLLSTPRIDLVGETLTLATADATLHMLDRAAVTD